MATKLLHEPRAASDYEGDTAAWCEEQARLLRAGLLDRIDVENIAEEIESLGKEQANALRNHLARVIEHLLKLDHSADADPRRGWRATVIAQRDSALARLEENPSLRPRVPALADRAWKRGRALAVGGLREEEARGLPVMLPYSITQLLDETYFGERDAAA